LKSSAELLGRPLTWTDDKFYPFMAERLAFVLEARGFDIRTVRAVTASRFPHVRPADELQKLKILPEFIASPDFQALATAFKRVMNITREIPNDRLVGRENRPVGLAEPAEKALLDEIDNREPAIMRAVASGQGFREAFAEAAKFKPVVDRVFNEVL